MGAWSGLIYRTALALPSQSCPSTDPLAGRRGLRPRAVGNKSNLIFSYFANTYRVPRIPNSVLGTETMDKTESLPHGDHLVTGEIDK